MVLLLLPSSMNACSRFSRVVWAMLLSASPVRKATWGDTIVLGRLERRAMLWSHWAMRSSIDRSHRLVKNRPDSFS
ncbi:hypothetical protein ATCV1_z296R [Acanthocystis turfacea chlorella virus 1]|uniref:Uncharacterized protein z296R n=1 Tax=Chlorovirus heliozoae TaxID=322019 RepID=A7K8Q6_9PHYC|nr:hypothetical protein ATCV1_z296R [Acanthocystis turfacea chlorella virus 1]ABT16430.1 hypothetical protein ATCV1_z296R [Acanthocystis turfacea chlorella virus 1]